jgi:excisionase family DNA binding protein
MRTASWHSPAPSPAPEHDDGDRYLRLPELARYSGLSVRTLRRLTVRARDPLPAYRVGRLVLVRKSMFDAWLARQTDQAAQVQQSFADVTDDDWRIAMALRGYAVKGGRR